MSLQKRVPVTFLGDGGVRDVLYLAWRYLAFNRVTTAILVLSIMLIVYLPVGLNVLVNQSARELTARAEATPLLIGAKGSPLELTLNSLYFESDPPEFMTYEAVHRVNESGLALPIPLYARFRSGEHPIVGTTLEYFDFRRLRLAEGRPMAVLGECVLGAAVARRLGVEVGDSVTSSPETVFDLAGVYPLKMSVAGVLAPAYTADDNTIFVDVKTAWIIQGLGHGHQDLNDPAAASAVLSRDETVVTANASVVQYNEISQENLGSFHFHGDLASYPLTALIAVPRDDRAGVILMGRFEDPEEPNQILRPPLILDDLLETILTIQSFFITAILIVGLATVATTVLVFALSLRLRKREIQTMTRIGGSRLRIAGILLSEIAVVMLMSVGLAAGLTVITSQFGSAAIRAFLLS